MFVTFNDTSKHARHSDAIVNHVSCNTGKVDVLCKCNRRLYLRL